MKSFLSILGVRGTVLWGRGGRRLKKLRMRASLVAQWLRTRLPVQGTWV